MSKLEIDLDKVIEKWEKTPSDCNECEKAILINLLIANRERLEIKLDYSEEKATELAMGVGEALGFDVGDHSNTNNPIQNAIDGIFEMRTQIVEWKSA